MTRPGGVSPRSHSIQWASSLAGRGAVSPSLAGYRPGGTGTVWTAGRWVARPRLVAPLPVPARTLVLASASPARLGLLRAAGFAPQVMVSGVAEDGVDGPRRGRDRRDAGRAQGRGRRRPARRPRPPARRRGRRRSTGRSCSGATRCWPSTARSGASRPRPPRRPPGGGATAGRTGTLVTGHALVDAGTGRRAAASPQTLVRFGRPTDAEIAAYVATGEPLRGRRRRSPSTATAPRSSTGSTATTARCSACRCRCCARCSPSWAWRSPTCGPHRDRRRDRTPPLRVGPLEVWPAGRAGADGGHHQRPVPPAVPRLRRRPPSTRPTTARRRAAAPRRRPRRAVRQRDDHGPRARRAQRQDAAHGPVRRRRAGAVDPALRHRPALVGEAVRFLAGDERRRPHRPQLRLPGRQGDPQGRRRGAARAPGAVPRDRAGGGAAARAPCRSRSSCASASTTRLTTYLDAGRIAQDEGAAAVALHARTAAQHYSGQADWSGRSPRCGPAVPDVPVLGNGDIWQAADALRMMAETGCDGVVVGRGCLGRPWLFRDLARAFAGRPVPPPRRSPRWPTCCAGTPACWPSG